MKENQRLSLIIGVQKDLFRFEEGKKLVIWQNGVQVESISLCAALTLTFMNLYIFVNKIYTYLLIELKHINCSNIALIYLYYIQTELQMRISQKGEEGLRGVFVRGNCGARRNIAAVNER